MQAVFNLIGRVINTLFAFVMWPLSALNPMWALLLLSVVGGVVMVWIFGKVSSQDRITLIKNRIRGNLLGVRLFQHDLGVVFRLQRGILSDTVRYVGLSLIPLLVLMPPVLVLLVELNLYFGAGPLPLDTPTMVTLQLEEGTGPLPPVSLQVTQGLVVESPPVRVRTRNEISWRIRARQAGEETLTFQVGDRSVTKEVRTGPGWGATSPYRTGSVLEWLGYPGEPLLDGSSSLRSIEVRHPPLDLRMWGYPVDWVLFFLVVSIVAGFAFKGPLGVEF